MSHPLLSNDNLTLGLEIELQIIDPKTNDLTPKAKDFIRNIQTSRYTEQIKPEITQSMLEINSSIHKNAITMHKEMTRISEFLLKISRQLEVNFCGGGTHLFQQWSERKIFPAPRFRHMSKQYGYLAKRFTVFSMHVHVGCRNGDDAIYLTHALSRYIPQLIALSASSPFYQGVYTGFNSTRVNVVNAFPLSGHPPYVANWAEFDNYLSKMRELQIVDTMKDFYWDIRPKPEFGTVEIRICDMPLTIRKAVTLCAYIQTLTAYLLENQKHKNLEELYHVYDYNRFQASRYGYNGNFIDPYNLHQTSIQKDILNTIEQLQPYAKILQNQTYLNDIKYLAMTKNNDAKYLRDVYRKNKCLLSMVRQKCQLWRESITQTSLLRNNL